MATIRVEKDGNYTVMSNYHLDDRRMSLKARGLLSTILRLPEDWDYTVAGLALLCKDGKDAIRSALEELEALGYVTRRQLHGDDGTFAANEYIAREVPSEAPLSENPTTVKTGDEIPPLSGNPSTGFPSTDNPTTVTVLNKPSTNIPIPPKAPQGAAPKAQGRGAVTAWKPERFEAFWSYYPRGEGKAKARQAWDKLKPDDDLIAVIAKALQRQKASADWQRGIGIPYASTYLNQRRWEDEARIPEQVASAARVESPEVPVW